MEKKRAVVLNDEKQHRQRQGVGNRNSMQKGSELLRNPVGECWEIKLVSYDE